jgi:hypothetical protein
MDQIVPGGYHGYSEYLLDRSLLSALVFISSSNILTHHIVSACILSWAVDEDKCKNMFSTCHLQLAFHPPSSLNSQYAFATVQYLT